MEFGFETWSNAYDISLIINILWRGPIFSSSFATLNVKYTIKKENNKNNTTKTKLRYK